MGPVLTRTLVKEIVYIPIYLLLKVLKFFKVSVKEIVYILTYIFLKLVIQILGAHDKILLCITFVKYQKST